MIARSHKVYAFIDSQNLNLGVSKDVIRNGDVIYKGWKLDFNRFRVYLKDKYNVDKAYLFIGMIPQNQDLYDHLNKVGYKLIYKPILEIKREMKIEVKGNVDAELVLHAMIELPYYDKAIIVSGDGDFHCLIEYLNRNNKLSYVLIPNKYAYSRLLNKFYGHLRFVSGIRSKLEYRQ